MENKHNPNCLSCDASSYWSHLPLDLLNLVFERLSFANFQRAKSVCSSWYSASRQSLPKNQIPWLILFPEDDDNNNNNNSCTLFIPEEKDKLYKTQDLGVEFAKSVCRATYGSWLLMRDPRSNFYILNLFTHERINLPPVESQLGATKIERVDDWFHISNDDNHFVGMIKNFLVTHSPLIWIDEKTKDYLVLWRLSRLGIFYAKNGDSSWNQIHGISDCLDMVYKDHKLYFFSCKGILTILDFSGEVPQQTFHQVVMGVFSRKMLGVSGRISNEWFVYETKLVVTVTGNVLRVQRMLKTLSRIQSFRVCKLFPKYEKQVDSLGDEAMLLDLGVTVLAKKVEGLKRNSIHFSGSHGKKKNHIFIFNFKTRKMKSLRKFDCSSDQLFRARWFLPSFTHT